MTARVFFAHPASWEPEAIAQGSDAVRRCLAATLGTEDLIVVPGRDDWQAHVAAAGGWDAWGVAVPGRFDVIVVPTREVGRATAKIVSTALLAGKPVLYYDGALSKVQSLRGVDLKNFKAGWRLE